MAEMSKIWIELENTPHVIFLNRIIKELNNQGHHVVTTAGDYAQVYELADLFNIKHYTIGRHFSFVELPYVLPQDFTVFVLMRDSAMKMAKKAGLARAKRRHGTVEHAPGLYGIWQC